MGYQMELVLATLGLIGLFYLIIYLFVMYRAKKNNEDVIKECVVRTIKEFIAVAPIYKNPLDKVFYLMLEQTDKRANNSIEYLISSIQKRITWDELGDAETVAITLLIKSLNQNIERLLAEELIEVGTNVSIYDVIRWCKLACK